MTSKAAAYLLALVVVGLLVAILVSLNQTPRTHVPTEEELRSQRIELIREDIRRTQAKIRALDER